MQGINGDDPLSAELTCQVALHAQRADVGLRNLTKAREQSPCDPTPVLNRGDRVAGSRLTSANCQPSFASPCVVRPERPEV